VKATIEKALSGWTKGGEKPAFTYPASSSSALHHNFSDR
jgi:hypothetical protein